METEGVFSPDTESEAKERYKSIAPAAESAIREATRTMGFDTAEYRERVTDDVIHSAQDAVFASLLQVQIGSREEFDTWREQADHAVEEVGHEAVDNVVWHAPDFAETAIAATFQDEQDAAVDTLRRQAFGKLYAKRFHS